MNMVQKLKDLIITWPFSTILIACGVVLAIVLGQVEEIGPTVARLVELLAMLGS